MIHDLINYLFSNFFSSSIGLFLLFALIVLGFIVLKLIGDALVYSKTNPNENEETQGFFIKKNHLNKFKGFDVIIVGLIVFFLLAISFYFVEAFLINRETDSIELYNKVNVVVIPAVGVIVTAIFSYLIFYATKQGLLIARNATDISRVQVKLEEKRTKQESIERYANITSSLEVNLLMSLDYLLNEINRMKEELIAGLNSVDFANSLSNGIVAERFTEEFTRMFNHLELQGNNNFLLLLYLSGLNRTEFDTEYIRRQRLRALFEEPSQILNNILDDIGLNEQIEKILNDRMTIALKLKENIEEVFEDIVNIDNLSILDDPSLSYDRLWRRHFHV